MSCIINWTISVQNLVLIQSLQLLCYTNIEFLLGDFYDFGDITRFSHKIIIFRSFTNDGEVKIKPNKTPNA